MAIKIVRNDQGNCINFYGSSNPTYWNACLSGEVDSVDPTLVNIKNDIKTAEAGVTQYEFFRIPYTEFLDEDNNAFNNASEVADYITLKGNVTIGTGVTYKGVWNADNNTPDITTNTSSFNAGDFYKIIAPGTHDLGSGDIDFINGDEVIFDGTNWERKPFAGALVEYDSTQVLLNSNAAVYADAAQGLADPQNIEQGWYFTNDEAGKKINWYFVGSQNTAYQITNSTLQNSYARVKMIKTTGDIFFNVYTTPLGDGYDQYWFRSRYTYAGGDFSGVSEGEEVILYWGEEPTAYPSLQRVHLTLDSVSSMISTHPDVTNDAVFSVALSTNSGEAVDNNEFIVKELAYKNQQYVQSYLLESTLETGAVVDESFKDLLDTVVDFKLDTTSTSIMLDNGYSFGVNTIKAVAQQDGTIKITTLLANRELFFNLDPANVKINEVTAVGGLQDVVNTLNELFSVGAFESVVITDPFATMVADVSGSDAGGVLAGSAIDPVGSDVGAGVASHYNQSGILSTSTISKAGEYFTFDIRQEGIIGMGLVHSTDSFNDGLYSGNATYADPTTFCVGPNSGHYGYQFSHWFHPSPDGPWTNYGANTTYTMREGWSSTNYAFRYSDEGQDWLDGTPVKMRVGLDANGFISIDYYDPDRDTLWTTIARSSYPQVEGVEFRLGIKFGDVNARLASEPKVHLLPVTAPTMYFRYIESPDGQYSYPLFATEEEANYYDLQEGGTGISHTHIYADDPTFTNWYMPDTNSAMNTTALPTSAQTFEGQPINWTEITSLTNADLAPSSYSSQTINVNELSAVNIQLHPQDAPYVTTIIDNDNSGLVLDANGSHLMGTAPEITGDNVANPSGSYDITVRRSNSYGSADGTLTLNVINLTAPEETIEGFSQVEGSLSGGLMQPNSLYNLQHTHDDVADGQRIVFRNEWVQDNVLPYLSGSGDQYIIGFLNSGADTTTVSTDDFDFAIVWSYVDANSHRFEFLRDDSVMTGGGTANVSSKSILVNSTTNAIYDFAIELDGTSAWLIACNVNNIMNEPSPNDGGVFSHYAEVTNYNNLSKLHFGVISMEGGLEEGTSTMSVIDTPTPAVTDLTSWTKAVDFSGGSEYLKSNNNARSVLPLKMNDQAVLVPEHTTDSAKTSDNVNSRPWATAVVFDMDNVQQNQHIWNQGEGAGTGDDNIYLRVNASKQLIFGWGREGTGYNECTIFPTPSQPNAYLGHTAWYGVYIAHKGTRLNATNATAANLADAFDIRLMNSAGNNWTLGSNLSVAAAWTSTGVRMDRSVTGDFTIGGRGSNRSFQGQVASMVVTTLRTDDDMPTNAEIEEMIMDPNAWVANYKVGGLFRHCTTDYSDYDWDTNGSNYFTTQVYLMGDGTNDSFSNGIRNQINNTDGYTKLVFNSMVSNDIENVTINGLS